MKTINLDRPWMKVLIVTLITAAALGLTMIFCTMAGCGAEIRPIQNHQPTPDPQAYSVWDCAPKAVPSSPQCTQVVWPAQVPAGETCTAVPATGGAYAIVCQ